jgi:teichuronic acid biosynthesis glycosyltransferase TuaC
VRVVVVAEYYPRAGDPVLGVWAHRQAVAARDAGAEVSVVVLHRPIPPRAALRERDGAAIRAPLRQPPHSRLDGIEVRYLRYLSPPRPRWYHTWGAWAAGPLALALRRQRPFDLVHAHYALPAGDAVRRAAPRAPLVVSVHGGDVLGAARDSRGGERTVSRALGHARVVLANSEGIAERCRALGAGDARVVHLGTDLPPTWEGRRSPATLVTVGHLVARKRHADVVRALARLLPRHPALRYVVVGDGPEREPLRDLARDLGVAERLELRGQLPPAEAAAVARGATAFVMPSRDEAFGVAYVEAMAGGVPAVGCRGEAGPEEIAAAGDGIRLVPCGDVEALARELDALLSNPAGAAELGRAAHQTVERAFTWEACGRATVAAYEAALR